MIVLILQIPESATQEALCHFVKTSLRKVWLLPVFKKGLLESCEIRRIIDPKDGSTEYQALIRVDDVRTGEALAKQLNGKALSGGKIRARIYHPRSPKRERRVNLADSHNIAIVDRRRKERRRPNLVIETMHHALSPAVSQN